MKRKLTIPSGTLPLGIYNFTIGKYKASSLVRSKTYKVEVVPGKVPIIEIRRNQERKVNIQDILKLKGYVSANEGTVLTWKVAEEDGFEYINIMSISKSKTKVVLEKEAVNRKLRIIIKPEYGGKLLKNGAKYKFQLTAEEEGKQTGEAVIEIEVAMPPFGGTITATPNEGVALRTAFQLEASEWRTDPEDLPLKYQFFVKANDDDKLVPLGQKTENGLLKTILPASARNNDSIEVLLKVCNALPACTQTEGIKLRVEKPPAAEVAAIASQIKDDFGKMSSANPKDAVQHAASLMPSLLSISSSGEEVKSLVSSIQTGIEDASAIMIGSLSNPSPETQNAAMDLLASSLDILDATDQVEGVDSTRALDELVNLQEAMLGILEEKKKRRKRALIQDETVKGMKPLTAKEVQKHLSLSDQVLKRHPGVKLRIKALTQNVKTYMRGMCRYVEEADSTVTVTSGHVSISATKFTASPTHEAIQLKDVGAKKGFVAGIPTITLGQELLALYESWKCTEDIECSSVCLGTAMFKFNLLKALVNDSSQHLSNVLQLLFINPETGAESKFEPLISTKMSIELPLHPPLLPQDNTTTKQCAFQETALSPLNPDICQLVEESQCQCPNQGYISVMYQTSTTPAKDVGSNETAGNSTEAETDEGTRAASPVGNATEETSTDATEPVSTTRNAEVPNSSPSVSASEGQATTEKPQYKAVNVTVTIKEKYETVVGKSKKKAMESMHEQFVKLLKVSPERVRVLDIRRGSTIVDLMLLTSLNEQQPKSSLTDLVAQLEDLLKTGNLPLKNQDGSPLTVPKQSLDGIILEEEKDHINTAIVIGVCVGVTVLLLVAVVILVCLLNNKKKDKVKPIQHIDKGVPPQYRTLYYGDLLDGSKDSMSQYKAKVKVFLPQGLMMEEEDIFVKPTPVPVDSPLVGLTKIPNAARYNAPSQKDIEKASPVPERYQTSPADLPNTPLHES